VLQSGGGTLTWTVTPVTNEAGATTYVEAGVVTGGKPTVGIPPKNLCGTVTTANPTLQLTGLVDQDFYTIAVAAVDEAGNIGPLSVLCSQPREVADFWANYIGAGGQAGGGCTTAVREDERGLPAGTTGLGLLTLAAIVTLARKRRR
jgi:hypothetical protein